MADVFSHLAEDRSLIQGRLRSIAALASLPAGQAAIAS
jgi:hypothetical protein